jgi:hypothetical protein
MTELETKVLALPDRLRIIPDANGMMYDEYDDVMEAADRIEAQAAETERLRDALKRARDALEGMARYSGMRESWQDDNPQYVTAVYEAIDVINAALEQSK